MGEVFISAFKKVVAQFPKKTALEQGARKLSYERLEALSDGLAHRLKEAGVSPSQIVGVACGRGLEHIISMLAIWKVGAVFMPLDTSMPSKRLQYIIKDAGLDHIINTDRDPRLPNSILFSWEDGPKFKDCFTGSGALAYLIYTSGSSGDPKGVLVSHSGLVPMLKQQISFFQLDEHSRSFFCLSIYFDASLSDIGTALLSGACLVIGGSQDLDPERLATTIREKKISYIDIPPSVLRLLPSTNFSTLKTIVTGGEVCSPEVARDWAGRIRLINVYGPTECTICTSMILCDKNWSSPDIGKPLDGVEYRIVAGELWISSKGLAIEYLNKPELSKEKFIEIDGNRYYRTGDRVRLVGNRYIYQGRIDRQIKLQGRLIAPEEIEQAILQNNEITEVYVGKFKQGQREVLVAAYAAEKPVDLRCRLSRLLPSGLVPSAFQYFRILPRNHANKIDISRIRETFSNSSKILKDPYEALIQQYFGYPIDVNEDLFEHGLDSFGLIELILLANQSGIRLTSAQLQECRSIQKIRENIVTSWMDGNHLREIASNLISDIHFNTNMPDRGRILLTGGSGFLGKEVSKILRARGKQVCFLVRNAKGVDGNESIEGDLSLPRFGWSEDSWNTMAMEFCEVVHLAAGVNSIRTFSELYDVNVGGTLEVLRFCQTGRAKFLHYASTLSVLVSSDQNVGILLEENGLEQVQRVYSGYAQTKFVAEKALLYAQEQYPWVSIYRFGLITGKNERTRQESLMVLIQVVHRLKLRPSDIPEELAIDVTPVEYAAGAFVEAMKASGGVFHIASQRAVRLKRLVDLILPQTAETIALQEWGSALLAEQTASSKMVYMALCRLWGEQEYEKYRSMDILQATDSCFNTKNTDQYIDPFEGADDIYLQKLINYAIV
jgi:amino acid adenylation domain-containing protein